jgi:prolyl-tRNA editing enzyme YbaK/EbsC (Cys-tRNA(Pro) deacylase)
MSSELRASAQRVQDALAALNLPCRVIELSASTRTSQEAADAIGCTVSQIAKSLVFRGAETTTPIMVIASGTNRVNEARIAEIIGEKLAKANADFVRTHTGYVIGGVAPLAHATPLRILIDEDLLQYEELWAAAGTPHAVFALTPEQLLLMAKGEVVQVV